MVDLNGVSGQQALETKETTARKSSGASTREQEKSDKAQQSDSIELSPEVTKALAAEASFDSEKVEKIKQAIADGEYPVDSKRVAQSMVDLEKLL